MSTIDEIQHDHQQMNLTDQVLAAKFEQPVQAPIAGTENMTPMQLRMAKARAAAKAKREAAIAAGEPLTKNKKPVTMNIDTWKRDFYGQAILSLIVARNPQSSQDIETIKVLADNLTNHVEDKFKE